MVDTHDDRFGMPPTKSWALLTTIDIPQCATHLS